MRFVGNKIFLGVWMVIATNAPGAVQLGIGLGPAGIVASWNEDVNRFKGERSQYPLY